MSRQLSFPDIIWNGLDKDYSLEEAAIHLGELINERAVIKRHYGTATARLAQLERLGIRLKKHD
jgi:hypothetical protein